MQSTQFKAFLLAVLLIPGLTIAEVTKQDFEVKTTHDLVDLCTASPADRYYREAIHFCHGFLVGAYRYHFAENNGPGGMPLVCFPESGVTRDEAIKYVIAWMQEHPQYMGEPPVETEFRALIQKWPCKSSN